MALSTSEQHRQLQVRLAALTVLKLREVWPLFSDPQAWSAAAIRVIQEQHGASAALARAYIRNARSAALGSAPSGVLPQPGLNLDAVRTSLYVTGPVRVERARRRGLAIPSDMAFTETSRAGSKHALNGGRETVTSYARSDGRAGFRRVTSGNSCDFCSLLAGRGAVYSSDTVDFRTHDGCRCSAGLEFR